jgi:hypothetical protein
VTRSDTDHLTILGTTVRQPVDHLEGFAAPEGVTTVRPISDEVVSLFTALLAALFPAERPTDQAPGGLLRGIAGAALLSTPAPSGRTSAQGSATSWSQAARQAGPSGG